MNILRSMALLCAIALTAGCASNEVTDIEFDGDGWGGPNLNYTYSRSSDTFSINSGALINEEFTWAGSEVSFEFLDKPDLVWGFVLTDRQFLSERRQALDETWVKTAPKEFKKGRELTPDQFWLFDRVAEVEFARDPKSHAYKVFSGWSHERIVVSGKLAVKVKAAHDVQIKRADWNKLTIRIANGKLTYTLNGRPGAGGLQIDERTNGRFGIFVKKDGPLLIRNLRLGTGQGGT